MYHSPAVRCCSVECLFVDSGGWLQPELATFHYYAVTPILDLSHQACPRQLGPEGVKYAPLSGLTWPEPGLCESEACKKQQQQERADFFTFFSTHSKYLKLEMNISSHIIDCSKRGCWMFIWQKCTHTHTHAQLHLAVSFVCVIKIGVELKRRVWALKTSPAKIPSHWGNVTFAN